MGYLIDARLDPIGERLALEVVTDNRMSGPEHYRVWDDGNREELPTVQIGVSFPPDCSPEHRRRIEEDYYEHNRAVGRLLTERGFR